MHFIYIGVFGGVGCLARYGVSAWTAASFGTRFAYGTLGVNVVGSLLLGAVMEFAMRSSVLSADLRLGICVGFMGGFTTFSTFAYDSWSLLEAGQWVAASLNILLNVVLCLGGVAAGIALVRLFH
ncbi:MAG: fluoride efflux transporter CrcB [Desulfuromonadaceae bacterium]|nr:fluoride efflux transporter CrcB [Desulfuromonadaceae bacterium]